ncbi:MAG: cyclophane-forming radical SAM/SPASM peptide maturase YhhB [Acidobacteriota bacterium]
MIEIDTVLVKVASRCNINCTYCYVYNMGDSGWAEMPNHISQETTFAVAKALKELTQIQTRPFAVVLHGGEPLLLGPGKLDRVLTELRSVVPSECSFGLQTNGILISEEILDVCFRHKTTVSVSIDGPKHVHDRGRIGHDKLGTYDKVLLGINKLRRHPNSAFLFSGLLAVIDPTSEPQEVYEFFKTLSPPGVDFLYRDGNHTRLPEGKESLRSTEYGQWLTRLVDIYLFDQDPLPIRFIDDLIKLTLGGKGTKDGAGLTDFGILVIDTDGSITKNDTLKSSFHGADRFARGWSVHGNSLKDILSSVEFAESHALQRPTSKICLSCPELQVCGGGMTLHRWRNTNEYDNTSVYCADQLLVIGEIRRQVASIQAKCA